MVRAIGFLYVCLTDRRIITVFTSAGHWALFWFSLIQSSPSHPIFKVHFNISPPITPRPPMCYLSFIFYGYNFVCISRFPHCATWRCQLLIFYLTSLSTFNENKLRISLCNSLYFPVTLSSILPNTLLSTLF